MYNTEFICTYVLYNSSLNKFNPITSQYANTILNELKDDSESDLYEMSEIMYLEEILSAFCIERYDEKRINDTIHEVYQKTVNLDKHVDANKTLLECIHILAAKFMSEDPLIGFTALFSYDYFHLTHLCLCDLFNDGNFKEANINALKNMVSV